MKIGNYFWGGVLSVALFAIAAGFLSGQSLQRAVAAMPPAERVAEIAPVPMQRALHGARGPAIPLEPFESPIDEVVVDRPDGWTPPHPPGQSESAKLAIVIRGIGEDATLDRRFAAIPFPITFAVAAIDEVPSAALRDDPRELLVDTDPPAAPERVASMLAQIRAGGILTPLAGGTEKIPPMLRRLGASSVFVIDGMAGAAPTVYQAARDEHLRAATRDIVIDAHEEEPYVAYMLRQAAKLARRTGVAIAVGRAYPQTYEALRRTLPKIVGENVEIVAAGELAR